MNDCNENLTKHSMTTHDSKSHWNASLPYPSWPFGTVCPKELAKWGRKNRKEQAMDDVEEALM